MANDNNDLLHPNTNTSVINGDWQRSDGNYQLRITDAQQKGPARVSYFNPRSINVAKADVSIEKNLVKLFVLFQDKGYEGSTYTLYYYPQKDILIGFYYQAPMNQTFEVIFVRKS